GHQRSGQAGESAVELLGPLRQRPPLDAVQTEGPEHLLEQPHVTELLRQVVAADLVDQVDRAGYRRAFVPGRRDADPLVTRELVEKGQQQGPPVEAPRIVLHRDVVALERVRDRPARPHRVSPEAREILLFLGQILRLLEDLAVPSLLVAPIALEVLLALTLGGGRKDRGAPGTTDGWHPRPPRG